MSIIDTLITDRTQADVNRVAVLNAKWAPQENGPSLWTGTTEELAEWTAGLKGSYNLEDLNRVGEAMVYLADRLTQLAYPVTVTPKTNWVTANYPTTTTMATYLENLFKLRAVLPVFPTTPAVPEDMAYLTYQEANAIEKILVDIEQLINNMIAAYIYCGQITCGQLTQFGGGF